jgi:uncharacterized protein (DUF924 family)
MSLGTADDVLQFWFGDGARARPEWFRKDPAFDSEIRRRFGDLIDAALDDRLENWGDDARSALARIVLLDQFTRNVYRDSARAFAGDTRALAAARAMVVAGQDLALPPLLRTFVYLPFEHAEDLDAQREAVRLFERLGDEGSTVWARKHLAIIERFGRFPHRNAALGRVSTPEEEAFLAEPGSRF